jgi:hypothetical protein
MKVFGIIVLVIVALLVLSLIGWAFKLGDVFMSNTVQRIGTQQSLPYVQSHQSELVQLVQQVKKLDTKIAETDDESLIATYKAERQAIIDKIDQDKSYIPADQVPASARDY